MRLPFSDELLLTKKFDPEMAIFSDPHYSRQKPGTNQFMPPGTTLVIRNWQGTLLFGWVRQEYRDDGERGFYCSIFRNQSGLRSSDVILQCERIAVANWGVDRMFTYIDPAKILSVNPGYCFKNAGWSFVRRTKEGKHLLHKLF